MSQIRNTAVNLPSSHPTQPLLNLYFSTPPLCHSLPYLTTLHLSLLSHASPYLSTPHPTQLLLPLLRHSSPYLATSPPTQPLLTLLSHFSPYLAIPHPAQPCHTSPYIATYQALLYVSIQPHLSLQSQTSPCIATPYTGFIRGILRGVRYAKSLRVLFLHRPPSWTTLVLYSRAAFIFNEPTNILHSHSSLYSAMTRLNQRRFTLPDYALPDLALSQPTLATPHPTAPCITLLRKDSD